MKIKNLSFLLFIPSLMLTSCQKYDMNTENWVYKNFDNDYSSVIISITNDHDITTKYQTSDAFLVNDFTITLESIKVSPWSVLQAPENYVSKATLEFSKGTDKLNIEYYYLPDCTGYFKFTSDEEYHLVKEDYYKYLNREIQFNIDSLTKIS